MIGTIYQVLACQNQSFPFPFFWSGAMLFSLFCLSICLGPWYEKAPVVRYPILFAAARLIDASTWGDLQRSSSENLHIFGRNRAKVEEGNFRSLQWISDKPGWHTHKRPTDKQGKDAADQAKPTQFYSLGSWLFTTLPILLDIPRSMSTGQPCP